MTGVQTCALPICIDVADPYRWLEDDNAPETKFWVESQNKTTESYLNQIAFRSQIKKRLTVIFDYAKYSSPFNVGKYLFFYKNDGLQNQAVLYTQKGEKGEPTVFLDPNRYSKEGTTSFSVAGISKDNRYIALSKSLSGSDWTTIMVMDIETKQWLKDTLEWSKFSGASWCKNGFYYSRYDKPEQGNELKGENNNHKVYYHTLGTPQKDDQLIYEDQKNPKRFHSIDVSEDEQYLYLYISQGTSGTEIHYKPTAKLNSEPFKLLLKGFENESTVLNNIGDKLIVQTNIDAPNKKIILIDLKNNTPKNWKTLIAQQKESIENASTGGEKIFLTYLKDASTKVYQYDYKGSLEREIQLPTIGTASGFGSMKYEQTFYYTFTSFTYPTAIYQYDIPTGKTTLFRKAEIQIDTENYETKQVFVASADGTKVPLFIVHKKNLTLNGQNPTLLYGYGGFNISLTPTFSPNNLFFLEQGGVYVLANLRGGGEYGEQWHQQGMLQNKQNVFNDCIAAAQYLIQNQYTSPQYLALNGGSNGGLLVAAVINQRPDLFRVAIPEVGVLDMLRYHQFTIGWGWAVEYGKSTDNLKTFENLYAYSPLHNIKKDTDYPAVMVMTSDHDDRVVPAHSFKYAATLQTDYKGSSPRLIRIGISAGHGAGKPIAKIIDDCADRWSFLFYSMGITPKL